MNSATPMLCVSVALMTLNTVTLPWKLLPHAALIHVCHDLLVPRLHYKAKTAFCNHKTNTSCVLFFIAFQPYHFFYIQYNTVK